MKWDEYKILCDRPDVLSRWLLEQTIAVFDSPLALRLEELLRSIPLKKPSDHKGGEELDMFRTSLSVEEVQSIENAVKCAHSRGVLTRGRLVRDYSGIAKAWSEYRTWLERA